MPINIICEFKGSCTGYGWRKKASEDKIAKYL